MNNWNYWESRSYYESSLRDRALGIAPEMEAASHISHLVAEEYKQDFTILDVGCGMGHFIRSLEKRITIPFSYTGADITPAYILGAQEIFAYSAKYHFQTADVRKLPFLENEFDISICSNTLPHIPNLATALKELYRVTRRTLWIRMLIGNCWLCTKQALSDKIGENGEPLDFVYVNIYPEEFITSALGISESYISFIDDQFNESNLESHFAQHSKEAGQTIATRIINGMQAKGYVLLPWKIVKITKALC